MMTAARIENAEEKNFSTIVKKTSELKINPPSGWNFKRITLSDMLVTHMQSNSIHLLKISNGEELIFKVNTIANESVLNILPLSKNHYGLIFGYPNQAKTKLYIYEGFNVDPKFILSLPSSLSHECLNYQISILPHRENCLVVSTSTRCWLVDANKNKWKQIKKVDNEKYDYNRDIIWGTIVFNNGDFAILLPEEETRKVKMEVYRLTESSLNYELKAKYIDESGLFYCQYLNGYPEIFESSPVCSSYWILHNSHYAPSLWSIRNDKIEPLFPILEEGNYYSKLNWLPDGSLIAAFKSDQTKQYQVTFTNKKMYLRPFASMSSLILPSGELLDLKGDSVDVYQFQSVIDFKDKSAKNKKNNLNDFQRQLLLQLEQYAGTSREVANLIFEYVVPENELKSYQKTNRFSVPLRSDITEKTRSEILKLHSQLEVEILNYVHKISIFRMESSFKNNMLKKAALEYFISHLEKENHTLHDCIGAMLTSPFAKEFQEISNKIPAIKNLIKDLQPKSSNRLSL